jgi:acylphosphatase
VLEVIVHFHGDVQGVGFRATAKRCAESMGLAGYAKNLSDGSVEVCAQGVKEVLEAFVQHLQKAFIITHIETVYRPISTPYAEFSILRR